VRNVVRRVQQTPLAVHAAVLAVVLVALLPIIGTTGQFSADEGAAIAQARQLSRGIGWTVPDSFPQADPDGSAFAYELSNRGGDEFAPFAKHPIYPVMLAGADRALGNTGMLLLSIIGTVAAAVVTALLARRLDPRIGVVALWVTGIGSPLLFDSYTVIAHSLGAALAGAALLFALRARERSSFLWVVLIALAMTLGTMLRTEMLFLGLAFSIALLVTAERRSRQWFLCAAPVVGAGAGWFLDRVLLKVVVPGPQGATAWLERPSEGFISARYSALKITWLLPEYDVRLGGGVLIAALVAAAIATGIARSRPTERDGVRVFAVAAGAAALVWFAIGDGPVPGLLPAFPLIVIGVIAWDRKPLPALAKLLALTFVVFSVAVLATQYASGGSGEWGGRYFAIGLPFLIPVVLASAAALWRTLDRPTAALAACSFVVLSLVVGATAVDTLRVYHHAVDDLVAGIDASARANPAVDGGAPIVLTTNGAAARFAYTVVEHSRWLTVAPERLDEYVQRLKALGVTSLTFVTTEIDDLRHVQSVYRDDGDTHPVAGWTVASMRLP